MGCAAKVTNWAVRWRIGQLTIVAGLIMVLTNRPALGREAHHPRWNARLDVEQAYTDNFLAQSSNRQGTAFTTMTGRLGWEHEAVHLPVELTVRGRVFSRFPNFN
ncbi:MAG: hypothetical protein ACE5I7_13615, partial [Candidatus Binatia bacterium]